MTYKNHIRPIINPPARREYVTVVLVAIGFFCLVLYGFYQWGQG